ncbi:hypothetical protein C8046_16245 [Serinibacter arcticus]|uniref:Uncharacterized protein n=1 Tax=Serinibacter arcticus TaxID=1655435 RepID=A0A2U1ZYA7_9MICO|nr:hypothetical protein [Serinibacter arcticus]PWD51961.1 hypothetical protein C8046_16245 [Serinibacter arcticus]
MTAATRVRARERPVGRRRGASVVVAVLLGPGLLGACAGAGEDDEPTASCDRSACIDLPITEIEQISGLDLPEGTEVLDSSYSAFQDWNLEATLLLPEGAEDPVAASEDAWDGQGDEEGVFRTVESSLEGGRLTLEIRVFTT